MCRKLDKELRNEVLMKRSEQILERVLINLTRYRVPEIFVRILPLQILISLKNKSEPVDLEQRKHG